MMRVKFPLGGTGIAVGRAQSRSPAPATNGENGRRSLARPAALGYVDFAPVQDAVSDLLRGHAAHDPGAHRAKHHGTHQGGREAGPGRCLGQQRQRISHSRGRPQALQARNQTDLSVGCEPASIVRLTEEYLADIAMDPLNPQAGGMP
jgi:hypothetical protein